MHQPYDITDAGHSAQNVSTLRSIFSKQDFKKSSEKQSYEYFLLLHNSYQQGPWCFFGLVPLSLDVLWKDRIATDPFETKLSVIINYR